MTLTVEVSAFDSSSRSCIEASASSPGDGGASVGGEAVTIVISRSSSSETRLGTSVKSENAMPDPRSPLDFGGAWLFADPRRAVLGDGRALCATAHAIVANRKNTPNQTKGGSTTYVVTAMAISGNGCEQNVYAMVALLTPCERCKARSNRVTQAVSFDEAGPGPAARSSAIVA